MNDTPPTPTTFNSLGGKTKIGLAVGTLGLLGLLVWGLTSCVSSSRAADTKPAEPEIVKILPKGEELEAVEVRMSGTNVLETHFQGLSPAMGRFLYLQGQRNGHEAGRVSYFERLKNLFPSTTPLPTTPPSPPTTVVTNWITNTVVYLPAPAPIIINNVAGSAQASATATNSVAVTQTAQPTMVCPPQPVVVMPPPACPPPVVYWTTPPPPPVVVYPHWGGRVVFGQPYNGYICDPNPTRVVGAW
ncbi:MAG: hypothetical protein WC735_00315 [Candidatus Paceibacterota bacterium]